MKRIRSSIRLKMTVATLAPLAVAIVLFSFIGTSLITSRILAQAQQKVQSYLNSAHEIVLAEQSRIGDIVRLISISPELAAEAGQIGSSPGAQLLAAILRNEKLGFLTVVDRYGIVQYRAANPAKAGDALAGNSLLTSALKGKAASGLMLITPESAVLENPDFPAMMQTRVWPTPHARPYPKTLETRGLMLASAAPLRSSNGAIVGAVFGGVLLNSQNDLVDKITRVVFDQTEGDGNATIFLDDVRIATTVVDEKKVRAIGTRMSEEVYNTITKKEKWVGRAFVLNDWYYTAYEPLLDIKGETVGALFVGTPEYPFIKIRDRIRLIFLGVIFLVTLLGVTISASLGKRMARPIKALEEGARRIANGEFLPDITVDTHDEISALAAEFNTMKNRLHEHEAEVLTLNRTLEQKVIERTAQLEEQGARLLEAQAGLARAERLAGMGLLSAGVAHEINNPLAIIRGNAELLQMALAGDPGNEEEAAVIIRQVSRIERIVRNLLVFSRGAEKRISLFSLEGLLDDILDNIHHQILPGNIELIRDYPDTTVLVEGDEDQLRQVFTNLILNGLQAMKQDGVFAIGLSIDESAGICLVKISDSGPGIGKEQLEKLFTPFYSTKRGGTGLGLAVSYGIIKDHGGEIHADASSEKGAVFEVRLPLRQL